MNFEVGLSKRERALLADWERARRRTVTLEEIEKRTGAGVARSVASRLVRKGVLDRIGRGIYAVRPFRAVGASWAFPALSAVEHVLGKAPHYVGGLAAFTLNRLTAQQHSSLIDVFVVGFRRSRQVGNARVVFHRRKRSAFKDGITHIDVDGNLVAVSNPERTLVDALDQFHIVGGMNEAIRLFRAAVASVDTAKLAAAALAVARTSTCQRLGLLLEREGKRGALLTQLQRRAAKSGSIHLLVPGRPRVGKLHPVWNVIENDRTTSR